MACLDLEFAFECVLLKNALYPNGYLEYYKNLQSGEYTETGVCDDYASYYDTMDCDIQCHNIDGNIQEGAEEYMCQQVSG